MPTKPYKSREKSSKVVTGLRNIKDLLENQKSRAMDKALAREQSTNVVKFEASKTKKRIDKSYAVRAA